MQIRWRSTGTNYGPRPDREALAAKYSRLVKEHEGLGHETGHVFDNQIDSECSEWQAEIRKRHGKTQRRTQRRINTAQRKVDTAKQRVDTVNHAYAQDEQAMMTAYTDLTKQPYPDGPGSRRGFTPPPAIPPTNSPTTGKDLSLLPRDKNAHEVVASPAPVEPVAIGRGVRHLFHLLFILIGALADTVAFYQAMADVLGASQVILWVAVIGFTVMALGSMHFAGNGLKDISKRHSMGKIWIVVILVGAWLALGAVAFALRVQERDGGSVSLTNFVGITLGQTQDTYSPTIKALVFLAVYVVTGFFTLVAAYLTHDRRLDTYRDSRKRFERTSALRNKRLRQLTKAQQKLKSEEDAAVADDEERQAELDHRKGLACYLKSHVRTVIASRLTEPELVAALLREPIPGCSSPADAGKVSHASMA